MKALILTGKYCTDVEFTYALYRLQEAGFEVDVAVRGNQTVLGIIGEKIVPNKDIPDLDVNDYELLILPGGAKAMEYLRQDDDVIGFIQHFHKTGKVIGSICHAAQLLISAGLVKGRHISGYYSIKDDIRNAGGTYVDAAYVTDGNIVSSPHYRYLGSWMKEVLRIAKENRPPNMGQIDEKVGEGEHGIE